MKHWANEAFDILYKSYSASRDMLDLYPSFNMLVTWLDICKLKGL